MSSPKFYLKEPNSMERQPIRLIYKKDGQKLQFGIGYSIYPELWDGETQKPTVSTQLINQYKKEQPDIRQELNEIKSRIDRVTTTVNQFSMALELDDKSYDATELKTLLSDKFRPKTDNKSNDEYLSLNEYIELFVSQIESGERLVSSGKNAGKRYKESTIKMYKDWQSQFRNFQKDIKKQLDWDDIDIELYNDIIRYYHNRSAKTNYIGRQVTRLKSIMSSALEEGIHTNTAFKLKKFRSLQEETDDFALSEEEVQLFEEVHFEEGSIKEFTRSVFVIMCRTALRISDIQQIKKHHLKLNKELKKYYLDLKTLKTGVKVSIPIREGTKDLVLEHLNGFHQIDRSKQVLMNRYLKEIAEELGIDENMEFTSTIGGNRVSSTYKKYQKISLHCGRRTGCTLMYKSGIPPAFIMKISGHKKETVFMNYIKLSNQEVTDSLAEHPYFNS